MRRRVNPNAVPILSELKRPDESLEDFNNLSPENYLLRWINHHLKNAGSNKEVINFSSDLKVTKCIFQLNNYHFIGWKHVDSPSKSIRPNPM